MNAFGYRNVEEVPLDPDEPLTEGAILMHLEFMRRIGEPTRVRPRILKRYAADNWRKKRAGREEE